MNDKQQLLPGFSVSDESDFDSFYTTPSLGLVKSTLIQVVTSQASDFIYISGNAATGKSHLLQAACHLALSQGLSAMYLPLSDLNVHSPSDVVGGLDHVQLLCFDDVHVVASDEAWQVALFDLFNQRLHADKAMFYAANEPAVQLECQLADWQSRLASCLSFQLPILSDDEKISLIQFRATKRGFQLNDSCCSYILQRSGRSNVDLLEVLERLDQSSLLAGRKITVPFIKNIMSW